MVRKPRGGIRVAASVESGGVSSVIDRISLPALTGRHLLVGLAVIVAIAAVGLMIGCDSCAACTSCSSCAACASCSSCGSCSSCADEETEFSVNSANYNCEYHSGSTLYYVEGNHLMALEDGLETGRPVVSGKGIACVYADNDFVYYIISGNILRAPLSGQTTSSGDVPLGSVLLSPEKAGLEKINGFALSGEDELCYWGQKTDGTKVIRITDRHVPDSGKTLYTGKYSNTQCYRGSVYFVSGEDATNGCIIRVGLSDGTSETVFDRKVNYYTLSDGRLFACVISQPSDTGEPASATLTCIDLEGKEDTTVISGLPSVRSLVANDRWVYYVTDDASGQTLIYRFSGDGETHQLVFRKSGYYKLYGVADSYFSVYGSNVYYICNYDHMPNFITIREHTVLDK